MFDNPRNREIHRLHKDGKMTYHEIARRFELSVSRVHQIFKKMERLIEHESRPIDTTNEPVGSAEYLISRYKDRFSQAILVRAVGCIALVTGGIRHSPVTKDHREFLKAIAGLSFEDCMKLRNCGAKTAEAMMAIKEAEGL